MSANLDPFRFARENGNIRGRVSPAELPRVAKEVFDREGGVEYTLAGMLTPKGEPSIRLSLNAVLNLACQRCMERLPVSLAVTKTLVFTREIDELDPVDEEDEDVDAVPLVAKVHVLDLIDEEVMLSLPIAPRHDEGACELKAEGAPNEPSESPFSVLSQLKKT